MKISQNIRHWASKQALTMPVMGSVIEDKLVSMHTGIFLDRADEAHRAERKAHLDDFFEVTMTSYVRALEAGMPEADAREITHIQANFDFYNHGWTEMMEFPVDELDDHYERYASFFEQHNISIDDPLGDFRPDDGIPSAPSTPEKLEEPTHPYAEGGFADDVYVEGPDGELHVGGQSEPADVDPAEILGVSSNQRSADEQDN